MVPPSSCGSLRRRPSSEIWTVDSRLSLRDPAQVAVDARRCIRLEEIWIMHEEHERRERVAEHSSKSIII